METQVMYGVAVVPLIIAAVGLAKQTGMQNRYAGLLAWAIGVGIGFGYGITEGGWSPLQCGIVGSALGLTAAGLYSTQKNAREPEQVNPGGTE